MTRFEILLTQQAEADLNAISDTRTATAIEKRIDKLETDAVALGKELQGDLSGYYSVRAAGQRYRIVYGVASIEATEPSDPREADGIVTVLVIGIRKEGDKRDVYRVASKRLG